MKRRFVTLDVFTTRRHAGNPLAVVLQSEGLDTEAMQAIARSKAPATRARATASRLATGTIV